MATFLERFNMLFDDSDMSQESFGAMFKATKNQIYNWRCGRGEPDSEMMKLIAKACGVSVDWLVGNTNIRTPVETLVAQRAIPQDLPPEALDRIEEFKELLRLKYAKK